MSRRSIGKILNSYHNLNKRFEKYFLLVLFLILYKVIPTESKAVMDAQFNAVFPRQQFLSMFSSLVLKRFGNKSVFIFKRPLFGFHRFHNRSNVCPGPLFVSTWSVNVFFCPFWKYARKTWTSVIIDDAHLLKPREKLLATFEQYITHFLYFIEFSSKNILPTRACDVEDTKAIPIIPRPMLQIKCYF